jgi:hypothetical protein
MALTVSDLMERARQRYNAVGDDFFSDKMLRDAIYDAQTDLAKEGYVIEKTFETTSVAGQREYTYPENTLSIKEVRYDSDKLQKVSLRDDPKTSNDDPTGTPADYAIWDEVIYLYPTPDTDDETIQIKCYAYPQDITSNTDNLEVPQEYREDIITYINYIMAQKDQNFTLSDRLLVRWEQSIAKAKRQRQRRLRGDSFAQVNDAYFTSQVIPIT